MPFLLTPQGAFSLAQARGFLDAFGPSGQEVGEDPDALMLAVPVDGEDAVAAIRVTQGDDGLVAGEVIAVDGTAADEVLRGQVERILSLDVDAAPFDGLVRTDPVLAAIAGRHAGLRPVLFGSPYEAAAWSIVSARIRIAQAVGIRRRIVEAAGTVVGGAPAFPPPQRLVEAARSAGVPGVKLERLEAVVAAALAGDLDVDLLRGVPPEAAVERLLALPGIGPFYAALILLRGAGVPDAPAEVDPVRAAVARAYGRPELEGLAAYRELADGWRPWRSWVAFLIRASGA